MALSIRRVGIATAVLWFGCCQVASAQISFGVGNAAHLEAEGRIRRVLEKRDSFVLCDMPLIRFVPWLRERYGINVLLDRKALDDFGIDASTPISIDLLQATLESGLSHVLDEFELTWIVRHEALVITTPEEAEARLETRVYPVRDLVLVYSQRPADAYYEGLMQVITSVIQPDSWDEVGGPGAIEAEVASLSLVISQTWRVHRQLEHLLTTLRAARDKQGLSPVRGDALGSSIAKPQPRPARRYRSSASSTWQVPRVYD